MRHSIVEGDDFSLFPPFVIWFIRRIRQVLGGQRYGRGDDQER
jgi:hypothetical protein